MIIPAAGLGLRLKSSLPKVLFPVNGRPMIDYLFNLYAPLAECFILVLHPSFERQVRQYCSQYAFRLEYAIQEEPTGMLDAILAPREEVQKYRPERVWITWCDQIAISPRTVATLARLSVQDHESALLFPTVMRKDPYIHFVRNERREIVRVLQRRENDDMPEVGESDMGLFHLSGHAYLDLLVDFSGAITRSAVTRERNFLPFIPWLHGQAPIRTFPGGAEIESVGINDAGDLQRIEGYLRHERQHPVDHHTCL